MAKKKYKQEYEELVTLNTEELRNLVKRDIKLSTEPFDPGSSWLKVLFEHYSKLYIMDNERIWKVGAIFIPLALSPFALLKFKEVSPSTVLLIAIASVILIWSWYIIAENQRGFHQKSEAIMESINRLLNVQLKGTKVPAKIWPSIRLMRLIIAFLITFMWCVVILVKIKFPSFF